VDMKKGTPLVKLNITIFGKGYGEWLYLID
jgi:hypothetical protein